MAVKRKTALRDKDFWEITRFEQQVEKAEDANEVLASYDTSNVRNNDIYLYLKNLRKVRWVNMENLNTRNFRTTSHLFKSCEDLERVSLNFPNVKPGNVGSVFTYCKNLKFCELSFPKAGIEDTYNIFFDGSPKNYIIENSDGVQIKVSTPEESYLSLSLTEYDNIKHEFSMKPTVYLNINTESDENKVLGQHVWETTPLFRPIIPILGNLAQDNFRTAVSFNPTEEQIMFLRTWMRKIYLYNLSSFRL